MSDITDKLLAYFSGLTLMVGQQTQTNQTLTDSVALKIHRGSLLETWPVLGKNILVKQ